MYVCGRFANQALLLALSGIADLTRSFAFTLLAPAPATLPFPRICCLFCFAFRICFPERVIIIVVVPLAVKLVNRILPRQRLSGLDESLTSVSSQFELTTVWRTWAPFA